MEHKTVAEEWESYKRRVLPPDPAPGQERVMREAFYAGCIVTWGLVNDVEATDDPEVNARNCEFLGKIADELDGYMRDAITRSMLKLWDVIFQSKKNAEKKARQGKSGEN